MVMKKKSKGMRKGGRSMKSKGYAAGGRMKSKGMRKGGKAKTMTLAQIRAAAKKKGYKLVKS